MTDQQTGQPDINVTTANNEQPRAALVPADAVFGQVVWLLMNIPVYRHLFLGDLEWMVMPPVVLTQYRLFRGGNRVVAFAAWAYLSEAAEARLQQPNARLAQRTGAAATGSGWSTCSRRSAISKRR